MGNAGRQHRGRTGFGDRPGELDMSSEKIHYKRSRFSTRLLKHRLYTAGHSWLEQEDEHLWRVGFTKFAVRMLGEIVELGFETEPGTAVETGQVIGLAPDPVA